MVRELLPVITSIARMYYLDGLGQNEIAKICGISRSTVSRALTTARERGIVRISVDDYDPRDGGKERELCDRFGLKRAVVVRSMGEAMPTVSRAVGYFASTTVTKWLSGYRTVGVSGGRTLAEVVHAMEVQPDCAGVEVVQLTGVIGSTSSRVDASRLSRIVSNRFQATCFAINAPAIVKDAGMLALFLSHAQIQSVWNMFASLDVALVGIGTLEDSAFVERQVIGDTSLAELQRAGAVGEICGRFYDASGTECLTGHRSRVVGIELETLRSGPEVIAITSGAARKAAILAAITGGLVHSLVIDQAGARSLLGKP
jgi:DNA-binding transcriptional regulator LsrR (DeoR family)